MLDPIGDAKRILFVLNIPTPYRDRVLAGLAEAPDIDLTVVYCSHSDPMRNWELGRATNYDVIELSGLNLGGRRGGFRWRFNPQIRRKLSETRPELVVVGGYLSPTMQLVMSWCSHREVPFILLSESHSLRGIRSPKEKLKGPFIRSAVKRANAFLAASPLAFDYLVRWGAPREKVFLFPNVPEIRPRRQGVGTVEDSKKIVTHSAFPSLLFVGRLIPIKNVETLLKAFKTVKLFRPQAQLVIAGGGPSEKKLRHLTRALELEAVTFLGFVSQDELLELYSSADLLLLPTLYETFGVVVLEALSVGTPVIISENVGSRDVIKEGVNGYVLPPTDHAMWAQTIIEATAKSRLSSLKRGVEKVGVTWTYDFCIKNFRDAATVAMRRSFEEN